MFVFCFVSDVHCSSIGWRRNEVVLSASKTPNTGTIVMRLTDVIIIISSSSSKCRKMLFHVCVLLLTTLMNHCSVSTSSTPLCFTTNTTLRHLAVDNLTGIVYVGAVNHIYQLDSNLALMVDVTTGPEQDNKDCVDFDSAGHPACPTLQLSSTNNYNQVMAYSGLCIVHSSYYNLSNALAALDRL